MGTGSRGVFEKRRKRISSLVGGVMSEMGGKMLIGLCARHEKKLLVFKYACNLSWNLQKAERVPSWLSRQFDDCTGFVDLNYRRACWCE